MSTATPDSAVRPDLVVHLVGDRHLVVDAKVPLHAYLDALAATDPDQHDRHFGRPCPSGPVTHRDTVGQVVLGRLRPQPGDGRHVPARRPDPRGGRTCQPEIFDYAYSRNVVLATPSSLIALLRAVALGWQQQSITDEAKTIHALGKELAGRLGSVLSQLDRLGASLGKAVESYNATVGTVENRPVSPCAN